MGGNDDWRWIEIKDYLPLLEEVGLGGQPGYYSCKWIHNELGQGVALLIRGVEETQRYPHLSIHFNPNTGVVAWFHHSPSKRGKRFGANEVIILIQALRSHLGSMPADVMMSLLKKP